jgi:hypothetical protein
MPPPPPQGAPKGAKPPPPDDKGSAKNCCKKVLKFLFSHIGLCGMVVAYSVLGGFIFRHLEQTNERMECQTAFELYEPAENDTMYKLWQISTNFRTDDDIDYALKEFQKVLQSYRKVVLDLGYDGRNCSMYGETNGPTYAWNFAGSMLFSVTVITTIGKSPSPVPLPLPSSLRGYADKGPQNRQVPTAYCHIMIWGPFH